jgi:hypothetical protein
MALKIANLQNILSLGPFRHFQGGHVLNVWPLACLRFSNFAYETSHFILRRGMDILNAISNIVCVI